MLIGDLEEIRQKVEKDQRRTSEEASEWVAKSQAVASCYR